MNSPEVLAPAGNFERLETALCYGADAVYLGGEDFNLRAQGQGFSREELARARKRTRAEGVRLYYCLNILARDIHLPLIRDQLEILADMDLDGLIIADPGVLALARERAPEIPIHLSTQANTSNAASVLFWQRQGVRRVNLARELDLKSIRTIRNTAPEMELEVFVHGAMCMALSGRCLMSAHLNQRSANLGLCTHPCRFEYTVTGLALEERQRPGQPVWEVLDGQPYTRILASEDLCLVKYLAWFVKNRIDALKIEGRMKTSLYLAQVLDVYVTALADLEAGTFRPRTYLQELAQASTRPLGTGMTLHRNRILFQPEKKAGTYPVLAQIGERVRDSVWTVRVKSRWEASNPVHILVPGLERPLLGPGGYGLEGPSGDRLELVHSGQEARLRCDHPDLAPWRLLRLAPC